MSPDKDKDLGCEKDYRNAGEGVMADRTKIILDESELPRQWYNVVADLPHPRRPRCTPARCSRWGPMTSRRFSRWT